MMTLCLRLVRLSRASLLVNTSIRLAACHELDRQTHNRNNFYKPKPNSGLDDLGRKPEGAIMNAIAELREVNAALRELNNSMAEIIERLELGLDAPPAPFAIHSEILSRQPLIEEFSNQDIAQINSHIKKGLSPQKGSPSPGNAFDQPYIFDEVMK